jgi:hypothetical protein
MGVGTIVPRSLKTKRHLTKIILVFPKFDPLTATGMALCDDLGQNVKI